MSDDETYIMETEDLVADPAHKSASENGYDLLDFSLEHLGDGMGEAGHEMEEEEFQQIAESDARQVAIEQPEEVEHSERSRLIQLRLMRLAIG
ncbi:hypothetical protein PILCRDRAFT_14613 [Piloderma croceum F 1598]|uniref:Uncharacterized protein n=1 Tax=Piloderma croceum (strain F 1598) TaxID=765440 RepID=A0A0C3ENW1_PILCF|nr:hypothetical protein PILCRDRAFT_14613 [Piloderma croceum F 1598]